MTSRSVLLKNLYECGILYLIRAVTSLHPGSGSRVSGIVDLPVQREAHTDHPVIYGSSLKGVFRTWAEIRNVKENAVNELFGPDPGAGSEGMGKAIFMDAKLLFFPVKSLKGIYAWVTSPLILKRFKRDFEIIKYLSGGGRGAELPKVPPVGEEAILTSGSVLTIESKSGGRFVVLEDLDMNTSKSQFLDEFLKAVFEGVSNLGDLYAELKKRAVLVNDEVFDHLMKRGMEIVPHIRIDREKGTVSDGGLWFQENLPPETLMYSAVFTTKELSEELRKVLQGFVQLGGDHTTGLGYAELLVLKEVTST